MSSSVQIRIPFGLGAQLQKIAHRRGSHEYVAFGLVTHARLGAVDTLFLREIMELPESDYVTAPGHGAAWRGIANVPMINRAFDEGLGVLLFHAHPGIGVPSLSHDDEQNAKRLVPMFRQRVPSRPHGSIVISNTHAAGTISMPNETVPRTEIRIRWHGTAIDDWPPPRVAQPHSSRREHVRQEILVGLRGQEALRSARVAVVGLSGGGGHVVQQLSHLGMGHLFLIDDDHAAETDRHRVVGMTRWDALLHRPKVRIMRRLVTRIGLGTTTTLVHERIPAPAAIDAIKQADIIIGCVDNLDAKADLQQLAHRYLIPYIDIGLRIRPTGNSDRGPRVSVGGNVITYIPGNFCLWCCEHLSESKLLEDRGGPKGYAQGRPNEAQVVSLNGVLASQAVNEVVQLITGYAGASIDPSDGVDVGTGTHRGFKKLDGVRGVLAEWGSTRRPGCGSCHQDLARGDLIWS